MLDRHKDTLRHWAEQIAAEREERRKARKKARDEDAEYLKQKTIFGVFRDAESALRKMDGYAAAQVIIPKYDPNQPSTAYIQLQWDKEFHRDTFICREILCVVAKENGVPQGVIFVDTGRYPLN